MTAHHPAKRRVFHDRKGTPEGVQAMRGAGAGIQSFLAHMGCCFWVGIAASGAASPRGW